ncbi:hypothetical protein Trco_006380 [Trichoderma cornu-damae]|uniref:Uncharacterized protein n=1 Tax=Trichoderma cornu-damae TaxID=654480 RepID=A0A9P8TTV1_9HYPO|nr:hypothetical protein Trco_006380 [Trichoderma cornu-damae]
MRSRDAALYRQGPLPASRERLVDSEAAPLELQQTAAVSVAAEDVQVLPVIGKGHAANLAKHVDRLLAAERLGVDQIDVVGLFGGGQDGPAAACGGKAQVPNTGHLGDDRAERCAHALGIMPAPGVPNLDRLVLEAGRDGVAVVRPVAGEAVIPMSAQLLQDFSRLGVGDEDVQVVAHDGPQPTVWRHGRAV